MLRGEVQGELALSHRWDAPHIRNYRYVEQVFKVPLWYIETLSSAHPTDSSALWNRYVASSPSAALELINLYGSTQAIVHILLPGYLADSDELILTRCRMLWRCCVKNQGTREVISFVTDHGEFVDFQDAIELSELNKVELVWQQK